ncbi:8195_t:CDS:10 [Ambispora gerdemannii]|uniref:Kynureninase n=1 Tax=Ambispora gerdemannii TaxID=144530 RepID=A0A9N8VB28_9GLOM|nr:8195_t:CDS:10 [Ambispora gerdemannii]
MSSSQFFKELTLHLHEHDDAKDTILKLAGSEFIKLGDPLSIEFAKNLDNSDELKELREEFVIPKICDVVSKDCGNNDNINPDEECIYFCGNSLGLSPRRSRQLVDEEFEVWSKTGVFGHFQHKYNRPWVTIDETVTSLTANLIGAKPIEVAIMNTLTTNLHLLMVSFYTPISGRYKILIEDKVFPSDQYAVESQLKFHGYDPAEALITVKPRPGEYTIEDADIIEQIEKEGEKIAVVLLSAVHYYNGQYFDIEKISKAAHEKGCIVGFDLAHAIGNVVLNLHDWSVDFALWCSYKYLNSGPGGIAGIFVHEKHANNTHPRFTGWWGHDKETRFDMNKEFKPIEGAAGYQLSNPSVLNTVSLLGSLQVFAKTSMLTLRTKSFLLTGYLEFLITAKLNPHQYDYKIITPRDPRRRGAQLSILLIHEEQFERVFNGLMARGVVVDERKPNCIRIAPVPLYNTFCEVWKFLEILKDVFDSSAGDVGNTNNLVSNYWKSYNGVRRIMDRKGKYPGGICGWEHLGNPETGAGKDGITFFPSHQSSVLDFSFLDQVTSRKTGIPPLRSCKIFFSFHINAKFKNNPDLTGPRTANAGDGTRAPKEPSQAKFEIGSNLTLDCIVIRIAIIL